MQTGSPTVSQWQHTKTGRLALCREGILEYYWGEHIHLGYYTAEERAAGYKRKDFKRAKIDFVDEMLRWSGAERPARILDVGCGIGGTSRHLAARFPDAHVQGALSSTCLLHPIAFASLEGNASSPCTLRFPACAECAEQCLLSWQASRSCLNGGTKVSPC